MEEDTHPNKGGFYVRVFADDSEDFPIDFFTIRKEEIAPKETEERKRKANLIAIDKIRKLMSNKRGW